MKAADITKRPSLGWTRIDDTTIQCKRYDRYYLLHLGGSNWVLYKARRFDPDNKVRVSPYVQSRNLERAKQKANDYIVGHQLRSDAYA